MTWLQISIGCFTIISILGFSFLLFLDKLNKTLDDIEDRLRILEKRRRQKTTEKKQDD